MIGDALGAPSVREGNSRVIINDPRVDIWLLLRWRHVRPGRGDLERGWWETKNRSDQDATARDLHSDLGSDVVLALLIR